MCVSVEYNPNMSETDPKALFQQLIPQRFLTMQDRIKEEVEELRAEGKPPIMDDSAFQAAFQYLFDDKDELSEAVYFLNLQGKKIVILSSNVYTESLICRYFVAF